MTCWNLGTKGYISFDWGDAAANDNDKTPLTTMSRSQWTHPQEGTPLSITTKQWQRRDAAANAKDYDNEVPKPIRQQRQQRQDKDGDNVAIIDKRLT